jgi:hypothetical protein
VRAKRGGRAAALANHQTPCAPPADSARFNAQTFAAAKVAADMLHTAVRRDAALNLAQQIDKFRAAGGEWRHSRRFVVVCGGLAGSDAVLVLRTSFRCE